MCISVEIFQIIIFFWLFPVKGDLNAAPCHDILDNSVLCSFVATVGVCLLPVLTSPVHKASSSKKWFSGFGVEEHDRPAQSPDPIPIKHLWDELERRL